MSNLNRCILKEEIQTYLKENENVELRDFSLKKSAFTMVSNAELSQQLKGLQTAKTKFPFLYETSGVFYPPSINLEQASSWETAYYKSTLVSGRSMIDLTAGFGIDSYAFAQKMDEVISLEKNESLVEICRHNYDLLEQKNLFYFAQNYADYLIENPNKKWDFIYVDPSRRIGSQRKYKIEELEPNILNELDFYFSKSETVLVKLSPLVDLSSLIETLRFIQEIHIVGLKNEVKEILLICKKIENNQPLIHSVNLTTQQPDFVFKWKEEKEAVSVFSSPKRYIYEPNSSILKSGGFKLFGTTYNLYKIHKNTHLYTLDEFITNFPGRVYEKLLEVKNPKTEIEKKGFHLLVKNFPIKTDEVKKKYKIKEAGQPSLIFTQSNDGKHILICRRIN